LSVFTTQEYPQHVAETIVGTLRRLIRLRAVEPTIAAIPWLEDMFHLMPERGVIQNPERASDGGILRWVQIFRMMAGKDILGFLPRH